MAMFSEIQGVHRVLFQCCYNNEVRPIAEVFGRVFVLTAIFIKRVIKYERRRREPLGDLGACRPKKF